MNNPLNSSGIGTPNPTGGFIRLSEIIAPNGPIPISRSTWFAWRKAGKAPAPVMLSPRISAYRTEDIRALIADLAKGGDY